MYSIPFALSIVFTLFQGGRTADFALDDRQKSAAFFSIIRGNQSRGLPGDVLQHFRPFIPIDDWSRLELVFNKTSPRTQGIMDLVNRNRNKKITKDTYQGQISIEMNENGDIVYFRVAAMKLYNDDILDLSKLPPTLRVLDLFGNCFTKLDFKNLPINLQTLYLSGNQWTKLDLSSLPPWLVDLDLNSNKVTEVNFENAPKTLRNIYLANNPLHRVDISSSAELSTICRLKVFLSDNAEDLQVISDPPIDPSDWKPRPHAQGELMLEIQTGSNSRNYITFIR